MTNGKSNYILLKDKKERLKFMSHEFSRTELLIGKDALSKLKQCKVAVFGVGGVGSFVVEGLVRSGVGKLVLIDDDLVCMSNINRQLHATSKTVGKSKVEVMRDRILEINPKAEVITFQRFYMPGCADEIIAGDENYIIDAIDTVTAKIDLIVNAKRLGIPVISAMGAGNKLDPTRFEVADIYETSVCPLAKVMRRELKKRGINALKVVYSKEEPIKPVTPEQAEENTPNQTEDTTSEQTEITTPEQTEITTPIQTEITIPEQTEETMPNQADKNSCSESSFLKGEISKRVEKRQIPGSVSFVPSVMGLIIAGEVIKDLIKDAD